MRPRTLIPLCVLILAAPHSTVGQTVPAGTFRVGAAKVDITPAPNELPKSYLGVLDHVYSRAIVIDNGRTSAALITLDAGVVPTALWKTVSDRIEKELGIPSVNVLITATHSHSVPGVYPMFAGSGANAEPANAGRITAYEDRVFESVKMAKDRLQPARISYGTGVSYLNVQRDRIDPATHRWWEGANYSGLSDKTVAVIKFESLNGDPIAVYYNYAMHAVINGVLDLVSGDVPGAASRYIESHFSDTVVALWSEGAAGDQNPIYFQQTFDLRKIRIDDYAKQGKDISNSMPGGGQGMDRNNPEVIHLMDEQKEITNSMGLLLGKRFFGLAGHSPDGGAKGND